MYTMYINIYHMNMNLIRIPKSELITPLMT